MLLDGRYQYVIRKDLGDEQLTREIPISNRIVNNIPWPGGGPEVTPGKSLHDTYLKEYLAILEEGINNLAKHIHNPRKLGLKVIVAINRFTCVYPCEISSSVLNSSRSDTLAKLEL